MPAYRETVQNEKTNISRMYKWLVLASFCLNSITNVFLFTAVVPIWSFIAIYYNTTDYNLNWFTNCYYIGPISVAFLFNPLIIKYFGVSQILSCTFTTLGLWLLVIIKKHYYFGLLAFSLIGIGESLYYQVPLHLSKLWFEPSDRILSTFLGQYASNIGLILGYGISAFYFIDIIDQEAFNQKYENLITLNAIFASITLIANFATLKKPDGQKAKIEVRETISNSLCKIFKTGEGIYDLLSISSFIGLSWCYTMLFGTQQYLIGQTYLDVVSINIMFLVGQITAGSIYTWKLQQQSNSGMQLEYDKYIKYSMAIGFWSLVFEMLFFEHLPIFLLAISNFIIGAGIGGQYSVLLESLMEKHFPVQELAIGSILSAVACAESFIITMITIIPKILQYGFQISCYLMIPSFCYITVFYQTQFKRFELEA